MDKTGLIHLLKLAGEISSISRMMGLSRVESAATTLMKECVETFYDIKDQEYARSRRKGRTTSPADAIGSSLRVVDSEANRIQA